MLSFVNDYSQGAHEAILNRMNEINRDSVTGYGCDQYCESAKEKIRTACESPEADIYFLVGGTQSNQVVIDTMLQPYEGVVAATTGHVSTHEAGAIEFTGHKVLEFEEMDGKISPDKLKTYLETFYGDANHEHMVFPGMVYISHPTEFGTLYTKTELKEISEICKKYSMPLFLDGARLGYALACEESDVTLADIAKYCDVFYIGGTKVGALFGEAVVFSRNNAPKHFVTQIKQHGALLAKGWLLGLQFDTLFTDNLYVKNGENGMKMAKLMKAAFKEKGYQFYIESPTNQMFLLLENRRMEELAKEVAFSFWEKVDENHTAVRFVTSWATSEEDIKKFIELL